MDFTIITPSFKQLDYLGCCIASVADQGTKGSENVGMCEGLNFSRSCGTRLRAEVGILGRGGISEAA